MTRQVVLATLPIRRRLLIQKVSKGQQFSTHLREDCGRSLYKLLDFFQIESEGIDIADNMPEASILI